MTEHPLATWLKRGLVAVTTVVVVAWVAGVWVMSSTLGRDLLTPQPEEPTFDLEIATVGGGTVVLTRTPITERDSVWGLESETAYGQVSAVVAIREDVVERGFRTLEGEMRPGDRVRFDPFAYTGDPRTAHGIPFEEVRIAGELGAYPAWKVEGDRDTWVIVIHGKGSDERRQALRMLPAFRDDGFPVLVITYRNDLGAPAAPDGRYRWGRTEWRDVEAAVEFALRQGAEELVLYGFSMGGEIASMFLHESDHVGGVVGVVLDSPVLDLEATVDAEASQRGVPGILVGGAKTLATLRFDIDWRELDQVERAGEFDVPVLLMHGSADETVPVAPSDEFAAARPGLVRYERFEGGRHVQLWNEDPVRYETAVRLFLAEVAAPLL
ncbi:MAG: alpha/beta hydrolase family protein [Acidimicrobiia bacterium]